MLGRQRLGRDLLQRRDRLAGAVSGRGRADDLRRPVEIEAHRVLGTGHAAHVHQRRQRHHLAAHVAHVEVLEVVWIAPAVGRRLHEDLPLAREAREVVDVGATQKRLERGVDVGDRDALLQDLFLVDLDVDLRHRRREVGDHVLQLGPLAGGVDELFHVLRQKLDGAAAPILQEQAEPARGADAGDRRRRQREDARARDARELAVHLSRGSPAAVRSGRLRSFQG